MLCIFSIPTAAVPKGCASLSATPTKETPAIHCQLRSSSTQRQEQHCTLITNSTEGFCRLKTSHKHF